MSLWTHVLGAWFPVLVALFPLWNYKTEYSLYSGSYRKLRNSGLAGRRLALVPEDVLSLAPVLHKVLPRHMGSREYGLSPWIL